MRYKDAGVNIDAGTESVLLGNGAGSFGAKTDHGTGTAHYSVAIAALNGRELGGRDLNISEAHPKAERNGGSGGGRRW